jgi:hypothetical protein
MSSTLTCRHHVVEVPRKSSICPNSGLSGGSWISLCFPLQEGPRPRSVRGCPEALLVDYDFHGFQDPCHSFALRKRLDDGS